MLQARMSGLQAREETERQTIISNVEALMLTGVSTKVFIEFKSKRGL